MRPLLAYLGRVGKQLLLLFAVRAASFGISGKGWKAASVAIYVILVLVLYIALHLANLGEQVLTLCCDSRPLLAYPRGGGKSLLLFVVHALSFDTSGKGWKAAFVGICGACALFWHPGRAGKQLLSLFT